MTSVGGSRYHPRESQDLLPEPVQDLLQSITLILIDRHLDNYDNKKLIMGDSSSTTILKIIAFKIIVK
jgi:hypothetical protein